jgi:hypothetical protein
MCQNITRILLIQKLGQQIAEAKGAKRKTRLLGLVISSHDLGAAIDHSQSHGDESPRNLSPGTPAMCYKCIEALYNFVRDNYPIEEVSSIDFPILFENGNDGGLYMTTYKRITPVIFPGSNRIHKK